jgi:8-oxo-dGTP pyrophosphatase MutT (NUDIX family)
MNYEDEHQDALDETGHWGRAAAGAIIFSPERGKFCLALRSNEVLEPGTLGSIGGAIDGGNSIEETLENEFSEEIGYVMPLTLRTLSPYKNGSFTYHNFVAIIDDKYFKPELNHEVDELVWLTLGEIQEKEGIPGVLHYGIVAIINDESSLQILRAIENASLNLKGKGEFNHGTEQELGKKF